jgi:hypothetical protein
MLGPVYALGRGHVRNQIKVLAKATGHSESLSGVPPLSIAPPPAVRGDEILNSSPLNLGKHVIQKLVC